MLVTLISVNTLFFFKFFLFSAEGLFDLKYDASKISIDAASVTGAEDVYAADKGNGLVRILMFDFDGQPLTAKSGNHLINLPFELNGSLDASSLIEFTGEMIVAGYNGEKVQANFENNYLTLDSILPATTSLSKNYPNPLKSPPNMSPEPPNSIPLT